ncbi:acyl-CoA dehydrogenase [compost metagenome]
MLVFPFGRRHTGPSDELDAEVAALIGRSKGDPALEELLAGCFRPQAEGDPVAALQRASNLLDETAPLHKVLHQAIKEGKVQPAPGQSAIDAAVQSGALQVEEGQRLHAAEKARRAVIDVDAFDKEQLLPEQGKVR